MLIDKIQVKLVEDQPGVALKYTCNIRFIGEGYDKEVRYCANSLGKVLTSASNVITCVLSVDDPTDIEEINKVIFQ
jgi:hypothetical protein